MSISLLTSTLEQADELEEVLSSGFYNFERRKGLVKLFNIYEVTPEEGQELFGDYAKEIQDIDDLHKPVEGITCQYTQQTLSLDTTETEITGDNWGLARICRRDAPWSIPDMPDNITTTFESIRDGSGVDIYILDSADYALTHPDFVNATDLNGNRVDIGSSGIHHGTWCASAAGGQVYGVAKGAHLWCVSTLSGGGFSTAQMYIDAIDDIIQHYNGRSGLNRPAVFSMSLGGFSPFVNILDSLIDIGIPVFISAGNNAYDCDAGAWWPISFDDPEIIGVGSLTMNDTITRFSNFGNLIDCYTPGEETMLADPSLDQPRSGTSFSTPMAAGVAACMLQGYQRLTNRTEVLTFNNYFYNKCTQDKVVNPDNYDGRDIANFSSVLNIRTRVDNNRIPYLEPNLVIEDIQGLTKL